MSLILLALGLVMLIEGLAYALAPSLIERMLEALRSMPREAVRQVGLLIALTGFFFIWAAWQIGL